MAFHLLSFWTFSQLKQTQASLKVIFFNIYTFLPKYVHSYCYSLWFYAELSKQKIRQREKIALLFFLFVRYSVIVRLLCSINYHESRVFVFVIFAKFWKLKFEWIWIWKWKWILPKTKTQGKWKNKLGEKQAKLNQNWTLETNSKVTFWH